MVQILAANNIIIILFNKEDWVLWLVYIIINTLNAKTYLN